MESPSNIEVVDSSLIVDGRIFSSMAVGSVIYIVKCQASILASSKPPVCVPIEAASY